MHIIIHLDRQSVVKMRHVQCYFPAAFRAPEKSTKWKRERSSGPGNPVFPQQVQLDHWNSKSGARGKKNSCQRKWDTWYLVDHVIGYLTRVHPLKRAHNALHNLHRAVSCILHTISCIGTVAQIYFHTGVLILSTLASKVQRGAPGLPDDYARCTASTYDFSNGSEVSCCRVW